MTVERADLSAGLNLERMAPVAASHAVQGQGESSPQDAEGNPRRRPPPPEEAAPELSEESSEEASDKLSDEPRDEPRHRIDSLG